MFRGRSLRFRIAFAYIGGALVVSGFVAIATYAITSTLLTRQRTNAVISRSFDGVRFVNAYLKRVKANPPPGDLLPLLRERNAGDVVFARDNQSSQTSAAVSYQTVPLALRRAVQSGRTGWVVFDRPRRLVFGTPLPNSNRVEGYFFYSLADLDQTLALLREIFAGVVAAALVLAAAVGVRLADRTIRPLREASIAAELVARGQLGTRLAESSADELGRLARSFNLMAVSLGERIARERQFVADASHELRTPLTALKTSVDFIADRSTELPPRIASAAGLAAGEVRALQRLVNDLLELTKAEAGEAHVEREPLDLVNFAREVAHRRAPDADVKIEGPEHLVVNTDKARLERVVGNLLENAVVHGEGRDVSIVLAASDGVARILVSDSGPGIPDGQVHRIFERFWRGDASRHRHERVGAGLGLAIARENAGLIGAQLAVSSAPDVGTTFEVTVPAYEDEQ